MSEIQAIAAALTEANVTPTSLRIEWDFSRQDAPRVSIALRSLGDFHRLCRVTGTKPTLPQPVMVGGKVHHRTLSTTTRSGWAVSATSFPHHDDWLP